MIQSQVVAMQKSRYGFKENESGISNLASAVSATDIMGFGSAVQARLGSVQPRQKQLARQQRDP